MDLRKEIEKRRLPPLLPRAEMKEILQREEYGYLPDTDFLLTAGEPKMIERRLQRGTVQLTRVPLTIRIGEKEHSFPVERLLHTDGKKRPVVIVNNFNPLSASRYIPLEELSEQDIDFLCVDYRDAASDDGDFTNGLSPLLLPEGQNTDTACGKIGVWAWANMRLADYALTLPGTDPENLAVAGHSRLGKTALFTAMMDERFKFVLSNAAGCSGDTLYRGNSGQGRKERTTQKGELICDIVDRFPYWFCKNYIKYAAANIPETFDQHFLLAAIAPRYVLVGSCDLDAWADPHSQQLCALAAGRAWEAQGLPGLSDADTGFLPAGEGRIDGRVGYFNIPSCHFFSRHSWAWLIRFIELHKEEHP